MVGALLLVVYTVLVSTTESINGPSAAVLKAGIFLGATFVVVTHELASIFTIADDSLFLDAETRSGIARGHPKELLEKSKDPKVRRFLTRGSEEEEARSGV